MQACMRVEIDSRYYSRDAEVATAEYDAYQVYYPYPYPYHHPYPYPYPSPR